MDECGMIKIVMITITIMIIDYVAYIVGLFMSQGLKQTVPSIFLLDVILVFCIVRFTPKGVSPLYCGHFWPILPAPDDR
jgi:hypothetical protein